MKNFVIVSGRDCDGQFTPRVYRFDSEEEARDFSNECNAWSDGQIYDNVDYARVSEYCEEHDLTIPKG